MFACSNCPKNFTSQTSLARHERNHSKDLPHVCPLCDVAFYRGDLLTRHMRLHDDGSEANRAVRVRKRCHTACRRCRDMKIKCNGHRPCPRCNKAGVSCRYDAASSRISRGPTHDDDGGEEGEMAERGRDDDYDDDDDDDEEVISPMPFGNADSMDSSLPRRAPSRPAEAAVNQSTATVGISDEVPIPDGSHITGSSCPSPAAHPDVEMPLLSADSVPWPWMHESLFLPYDSVAALSSAVSADTDFPMDHTFNFPIGGQVSLHPEQNGSLWDNNRTNAEPHIPKNYDLLQLEAPNALLPSSPPPLAPECLVAPIRPTSENPSPPTGNTMAKCRLIDELVEQASRGGAAAWADSGRSTMWLSASPRLAGAFDLESATDMSDVSMLKHFVELYLENFHPLWPLFSRQTLDTENLHPLLYLVLTSIGAMYGGRPACDYGTMMHNSVRNRLITTVSLEGNDDDLLWLGQARLLTQVAALYFGQPKAFSYAQHLGALLVVQARRMDLFSAASCQSQMSHFNRLKYTAFDSERLDIWIKIESRRRLAFGIFRGDTFTSILLNIKPLVTLDEIDLEFPACDAVWNGHRMSPRAALEMVDYDRTPSRHLRASDVYHILLDKDELLPPLEPLGHELLLFGLQWLVWRFSRDHHLFERLTGREELSDIEEDGYSNVPAPLTSTRKRSRDTITSESESLGALSRQMRDLAHERRRLMSALCKWEKALPVVKTFAETDQDRSYILSSLILYHLGYMRLYAPLQDVHQIQYRLADRRPLDDGLIREVLTWANSARAGLAVERISSMCSLIEQESQKGIGRRSKFNIIAFVGLHHGAALLWAYVGARGQNRETGSSSSQAPEPLIKWPETLIQRSGRSDVLGPFIDLYERISPARWSSFAEATKLTSSWDFPVCR